MTQKVIGPDPVQHTLTRIHCEALGTYPRASGHRHLNIVSEQLSVYFISCCFHFVFRVVCLGLPLGSWHLDFIKEESWAAGLIAVPPEGEAQLSQPFAGRFPTGLVLTDALANGNKCPSCCRKERTHEQRQPFSKRKKPLCAPRGAPAW